jgi:serine/threonine protein kinase
MNFNFLKLDLKSDNLMLTIEDTSLLEDFEKAEIENPSARKIINETRSIYRSRSFGKPKGDRWGYPVLCDFGEARIGKDHQTGPMIQPHIYRAPEVTFDMIWGSPIDIWNLGALVGLFSFLFFSFFFFFVLFLATK